ncbi:hypothetical protein [Deinococcus sp. Leaf326]|uniref:hypothetical protein n=1 Tax=Deinococcus sp. Leaf326 TaxID=1736338 RepID=UPI000A7B9BA1|nr:hypothetical protein [Deinococcus sp. Leaf326]
MTELARLLNLRRPGGRHLLLGLTLVCSGTAWGQAVTPLSLQVESVCEVAGQTPDVLTLRCTRGFQPSEGYAALLGLGTSPLQPLRLLETRTGAHGEGLFDYERLVRPEGYQLDFY